MRKYSIEDLISLIKEQVQTFLLDGGEFYPFGTCIDKNDQLVPVSAYLDGEFPSSLELISMLEKRFREKVEKGEYKVAAIIIDVTVKEDGVGYDAIEIRFFEPNSHERKEYIKYTKHSNYIEFI
ncbi:hypothetical protein [Pedobacter polysacchareus]|uniref:hypothetical protein n=1 Tax=Pedobacter polysacchareus TaxID=2861973 RepID=UPI001C994A12|nr:hypothetical protein [Pedobacter polysacchareus]